MVIAAQGLEYRRPLQPGQGVARLTSLVRKVVPSLEADRPVGPEIEAMADLIRNGAVDDAMTEIGIAEGV
jgi:histidine ammonia-lyase